tara:strand:- start:571 stop:1029 length:459 start_codon:yes stop_codon:yes gene_type:complete
MEVSKQEKLLSGPEIITMALDGLSEKHLTYVAAMITAPNTALAQAGNTAFVSTRAQGKHSDKMKGSIYNADTLKNLEANILEYLEHLQRNAVKYYEARFIDRDYIDAFRGVYEKVKGQGIRISIGENESKTSSFVALVVLDSPQQKGRNRNG